MISKFKFANHDEWLELRRHYIGGSDAGAVMGMNAYTGPYALWAEKTGRVDGFAGSVATDVGTLLEPYVAQQFELQTGKRVRRDNFTMVNDLYPWACADVDRRIVGENALLECKTTTSIPYMRLFPTGEYPETWYCQMTHYLAVTGAERIYLAVLIGNREVKVFPPLERDQAEIDALMAAEKDFWQHVIDDTPPVAAAADDETVNDLFRDTVTYGADTPLDLTGDAGILQEYAEATEALKQAKDHCDALKTQICALMGEYSYGSSDTYRVKWTPVTTSRFDSKAFAKANPGIDLAPFYKESTSRRFDFARVNRER